MADLLSRCNAERSKLIRQLHRLEGHFALQGQVKSDTMICLVILGSGTGRSPAKNKFCARLHHLGGHLARHNQVISNTMIYLVILGSDTGRSLAKN